MRLVGGVRCKVTRNFPTYPPRVVGIMISARFGWDGHEILIWTKKNVSTYKSRLQSWALGRPEMR
jgi:hypothetical protein